MRQASSSEFRKNAKLFFERVEKGESVRVTRNGIPIADIVPFAKDLPSRKRNTFQPLIIDGEAVSTILLQDRENQQK